jgi:hypothetical protein
VEKNNELSITGGSLSDIQLKKDQKPLLKGKNITKHSNPLGFIKKVD